MFNIKIENNSHIDCLIQHFFLVETRSISFYVNVCLHCPFAQNCYSVDVTSDNINASFSLLTLVWKLSIYFYLGSHF